MQHQPFTTHTKMADIVTANHSLLLVMPRLGIRLGFGEQSVKEVCDRYNLDVDFVLLIFNVYTFEGYLPAPDILASTNLKPLVPYLQSSHHYYLSERLPHIKRHLHKPFSCLGRQILPQIIGNDRFRVPDTKRIDDPVLVADDRNIIRHRAYG